MVKQHTKQQDIKLSVKRQEAKGMKPQNKLGKLLFSLLLIFQTLAGGIGVIKVYAEDYEEVSYTDHTQITISETDTDSIYIDISYTVKQYTDVTNQKYKTEAYINSATARRVTHENGEYTEKNPVYGYIKTKLTLKGHTTYDKTITSIDPYILFFSPYGSLQQNILAGNWNTEPYTKPTGNNGKWLQFETYGIEDAYIITLPETTGTSGGISAEELAQWWEAEGGPGDQLQAIADKQLTIEDWDTWYEASGDNTKQGLKYQLEFIAEQIGQLQELPMQEPTIEMEQEILTNKQTTNEAIEKEEALTQQATQNIETINPQTELQQGTPQRLINAFQFIRNVHAATIERTAIKNYIGFVMILGLAVYIIGRRSG